MALVGISTRFCHEAFSFIILIFPFRQFLRPVFGTCELPVIRATPTNRLLPAPLYNGRGAGGEGNIATNSMAIPKKDRYMEVK